MRDGIPCHFASAVVSGVTATFVASPVDVIKTRSESAIYGIYIVKMHRSAELKARKSSLF